MNFDSIIVRDTAGDQRYSSDQLPLKLGTGISCEIRIPGPGHAPIALLDELDGEPFIQPVDRAGALSVNGAALTTAKKLSIGDQLEFFGTRISIVEESAAMVLQIELEGSAYITRPPQTADAGSLEAEESIAPTAFRRAAQAQAAMAPKKTYRWQTIVGAGLAILALVSWLLFSARSIQFDVQPSGPHELSISGGWFKLPFGDRMLMRQGSYTVHVQKKGYYDVSQALKVDATPSRTVLVSLRKLPAAVTVFTDPVVDAVVTVDGSKVGQAPYGPLELEPGTHSISISADRYLPFDDRLTVAGLGQTLSYHVQMVPQWANVDIVSEPSGAAVYRGQTSVGSTPLRLELMEGSHNLSVVANGFKAWDGTIETKPNQAVALPLIRLEPANAELQINSIPRGANITVNGRYRGQSPIKLALSPGIDYQIGLSKAGYGSTVRRVRLQAAAFEAITVDLSARVGKLALTVVPSDAQIYIDGRSRGNGSMSFDLSSAPHRIEVKKEGYQSFSRTVTPRPGYPQTIQVRLFTDAEVMARSSASTIATAGGHALRRVEPGGFTMGSSRREQGRRANEVIVPVSITKPFYIGAKEVSNREFLRFRKNHISGENVHVALAGDMNPVVNVSWSDAVQYCNWLSTQEGLPLAYEKKFEKWQAITPAPAGYRLPTEAEWVWAIRYQGRTKAQIYPWGDRLPPRQESGNYADRAASALVPSVLPNFSTLR